jgi:hypothetical protein
MSNVDNDNNEITLIETTKNKGGRPSKAIKFKIERDEILTKLKNILNINDTNDRFFMYDLEHDDEKIKQIMALKDKVFDYFTSKNNSVFRNFDTTSDPHSSLIRLIFKEMKYEVIILSKLIKRDSKSVNTSMYLILPPKNN